MGRISWKSFCACSWVLIYGLSYIYLQVEGAFHFLFVEQTQLFLYDWAENATVLLKPAGLAVLVANFCIQHFAVAYVGPLIMSGWIVVVGVLLQCALTKAFSARIIQIMAILPVIASFCAIFVEQYHYASIVASAFLALCLWGYFEIVSHKFRLAYVWTMTIVLFLAAGSVSVLFFVITLCYELFHYRTKAYVHAIPFIAMIVLVMLGQHKQWYGELRLILLPDSFYNNRMQPLPLIYFAWASIPMAFIVATIADRLPSKQIMVRVRAITLILLLVLCGGYVFKTTPLPDVYEELDCYLRKGEWQKLLTRVKTLQRRNYVYATMQNLALAESRQLADKMFFYPQMGVKGIHPEWNKIPYLSMLLSDLYFSMGQIALSQRMAFEANVTYNNNNPRMLMRLVQTNIIFGQYEVAEKYICRLEHTKYYRSWATAQRRFLHNESSIMQDSLLAEKRKCLLSDNIFAQMPDGDPYDLIQIARHAPTHTNTLQYAGCLYLLAGDLISFRTMLEEFYGSDVLPTLPRSFQEAVIAFSESDTQEWSKYHVSDDVIRQYHAFHDCFVKNKQKAQLANVMYRQFSNTYWYYYMFSNHHQ